MTEDRVTTYLVQVINKPSQIIALKVWHTPPILIPIKYLAELTAEPR